MHSLSYSVDLAHNASYVRVPDSVGSSMRMAHSVTKMYALTTDFTFCHGFSPPSFNSLKYNISILSEEKTKIKRFFDFLSQIVKNINSFLFNTNKV